MRIVPLHVGCVAKQRFDTFKAAERVAKRQRRGSELRIAAYRCEWCRGYHVGEDLANIRKRKAGERKTESRKDEIEWA